MKFHKSLIMYQNAANNDTEIIWGVVCHDDSLEDEIICHIDRNRFSKQWTKTSTCSWKIGSYFGKSIIKPVVAVKKNLLCPSGSNSD